MFCGVVSVLAHILILAIALPTPIAIDKITASSTIQIAPGIEDCTPPSRFNSPAGKIASDYDQLVQSNDAGSTTGVFPVSGDDAKHRKLRSRETGGRFDYDEGKPENNSTILITLSPDGGAVVETNSSPQTGGRRIKHDPAAQNESKQPSATAPSRDVDQPKVPTVPELYPLEALPIPPFDDIRISEEPTKWVMTPYGPELFENHWKTYGAALPSEFKNPKHFEDIISRNQPPEGYGPPGIRFAEPPQQPYDQPQQQYSPPQQPYDSNLAPSTAGIPFVGPPQQLYNSNPPNQSYTPPSNHSWGPSMGNSTGPRSYVLIPPTKEHLPPVNETVPYSLYPSHVPVSVYTPMTPYGAESQHDLPSIPASSDPPHDSADLQNKNLTAVGSSHVSSPTFGGPYVYNGTYDDYRKHLRDAFVRLQYPDFMPLCGSKDQIIPQKVGWGSYCAHHLARLEHQACEVKYFTSDFCEHKGEVVRGISVTGRALSLPCKVIAKAVRDILEMCPPSGLGRTFPVGSLEMIVELGYFP